MQKVFVINNKASSYWEGYDLGYTDEVMTIEEAEAIEINFPIEEEMDYV